MVECQEIQQKIVEDQNFRKSLAFESFYWFFHIYFSHYIKYSTADFQKEWCNLAQDWNEPLLEILGFRGSAKTSYMMMAFPIWATIIGKVHFSVLSSSTFDQVKDHIYNIKTELDENKLLNIDFGPFDTIIQTGKREEWQKTSLIIPRYATKLLARSAGQKIRGIRFRQYRPQLLVIDDIEDLKMVRTKESRDKTFEWVDGEALPAMADESKVIMIGNLLHSDSVMNRMKQRIKDGLRKGVVKEYEFFKDELRNIPSWQSKFDTLEKIEVEKKKYDLRTWQREFRLKIIPEEGQEIKDEWIQYYDNLPDEAELFHQGTGVDLAISKKSGADYTSMVSGKLFSINGAPRIYIMSFPVNERLSGFETIEKAKNISLSLGNGIVTDLWVEDVAYQKKAIEDMQREGLPAQGVNITTDKRARLRTNATYLQNGTVLFPRKGCEDLIIQLTGFGIEAHDDLVDAFNLLVRALISIYSQEPRLTIF